MGTREEKLTKWNIPNLWPQVFHPRAQRQRGISGWRGWDSRGLESCQVLCGVNSFLAGKVVSSVLDRVGRVASSARELGIFSDTVERKGA